MEDQEQSELEFNAWLDSIQFVDIDGEVVKEILQEDTSEDPEGDRE